MSVPVVAFFTRALRVDSRRGRTYLTRTLLLLLILAGLGSAHVSGAFFGAPGLRLFQAIMSIDFFLICLAGPGYFAAVITEEKEEMTLGMLKMAGLSPVSILLGKSTSQMLAAITLLLAQVPFAVLAVTLGGVSLAQIVAGYAALVAYMVFVSNLGLLCSTVCLRTWSAGKLTGVLLLGFFLVPPIGRAILASYIRDGVLAKGGLVSVVIGGFLGWMRDASALNRIGAVMQTGFSGSAIGFQVLSNLGMGLFLFLTAWATFDRYTREEKAIAPALGLVTTRRSGLRWLGAGRTWSSALAWKDFHFMAGGKSALLIKPVLFGILLGGIALFWHMSGMPLDLEGFGGMTMGVMLVLIFLELALHTSRMFGNERKWRTLSGIMILPVSTRRIAYSKVLGCLLALIPAVIWFCLGVVLSAEAFIDDLPEILDEPGMWFAIILVVFFLHLVAYLSLAMKRGGLLLAFAILFFGVQFLTPIFMLSTRFGSATGGFIMMSLVLLGLAAVLHYATLRQLERVAAAE